MPLFNLEELHKDEAPIPKDSLKQDVVDDFKFKELAGKGEASIKITLNPEDGSDILIKVIDPHAAAGYLVFQDDASYKDWLSQQLYEPSQDEIEEASLGARS